MTFEKDHAAGKHQPELVEMMDKLHKALEGHQRALGLIALTRMIAVLLGPAAKETREDMLKAMPDTVRGILGAMDEMMRNSR